MVTVLNPSESSLRQLYVEEIPTQINTSISLSLSPSSADPGGSITWSGKLTRSDGVNAANLPVKLKNQSGSTVSSATTDSNGNFQATFSAPSVSGTYYYYSKFEGATTVGVDLLPSSSLERYVQVGEFKIPWNWVIGGLVVLGVIWYVSGD